MFKNVSLEDMPLNLARVYVKAKQVLESKVPGNILEEYSGVNHTTIYRVRNHSYRVGGSNQKTSKWEFGNLRLKTMLLLANYPNKHIVNPFNHKVNKFKYEYYLNIAEVRYDVHFDDIASKIFDLTHTVANISELSRRLRVPRTFLSRLKRGKYKVINLHIADIAWLLNAWGVVCKNAQKRQEKTITHNK